MSLLRITKQTVWRPFADDLNIERGIVRGWVVFIPRSAEIQPIVRGFYKQRIPNSIRDSPDLFFLPFFLYEFFIPSNYNFRRYLFLNCMAPYPFPSISSVAIYLISHFVVRRCFSFFFFLFSLFYRITISYEAKVFYSIKVQFHINAVEDKVEVGYI